MFSLDIVEGVVSFLWDDARTISYCTFVSRTWYYAARPFLFRCIRLDGWDRVAKLEALLLQDDAIGHWIKELNIRAKYRFRPSGWVFDPRAGEGLVSAGTQPSDQFPGPILSERLKKVHTLTLMNIETSHPRISGETIRRLSSAFASTVRSLTFQSCLAHEGFSLAFIHAFPHVHDVQLRARQMPRLPVDDRFILAFKQEHLPFLSICRGDPDPKRTHPTIPLTSLSIEDSDFNGDGLSRMFCLKSLRNVHMLEIHHTGSPLPTDLVSEKILPECGHTVETLKLSMATLPDLARECYLFLNVVPRCLSCL